MVRELGSFGLAYAASGFVAFVVLYHLLANWRATQMGRHVMAFMGVCAAIMTYVVASALLGYAPGREWARLLVYWALGGVVWWRIMLLLKEQAASRRAQRRALDAGEPNLAPTDEWYERLKDEGE